MTIIAICLLLALQSGSAAREPGDANAILAKAIEAAGGAEALKAARVLNWYGKATIHAGGRQIKIEGRWTVEPPDRASLTTWEADKGQGSARRMVIDGFSGSLDRAGTSMPMSPTMLANERDQFYLYSVLKSDAIAGSGGHADVHHGGRRARAACRAARTSAGVDIFRR